MWIQAKYPSICKFSNIYNLISFKKELKHIKKILWSRHVPREEIKGFNFIVGSWWYWYIFKDLGGELDVSTACQSTEAPWPCATHVSLAGAVVYALCITALSIKLQLSLKAVFFSFLVLSRDRENLNIEELFCLTTKSKIFRVWC